jgi:hypothetical protein
LVDHVWAAANRLDGLRVRGVEAYKRLSIQVPAFEVESEHLATAGLQRLKVRKLMLLTTPREDVELGITAFRTGERPGARLSFLAGQMSAGEEAG